MNHALAMPARFAVALAPLALAALGPLIGHAWLGHGLYKLALLALPFACGCRAAWPARPTGRQVALAVTSGAMLGLIAFCLIAGIVPRFISFSELRANFDARYGYTPLTAGIAALAIASLNALLEEWFYRGFLDRQLGAPLSALVFSLQHVIVLIGLGGPAASVAAGIAVYPAALIWTYVTKQGGISMAFLSHAITDAVFLAGGFYLLGYI